MVSASPESAIELFNTRHYAGALRSFMHLPSSPLRYVGMTACYDALGNHELRDGCWNTGLQVYSSNLRELIDEWNMFVKE